MKSLLKFIGCATLGVITFFVGIFVYSSVTSSSYEEKLLPYVEESAEILSSWDYKKVRPLMHHYIVESGSEDSMVNTIKLYSKLGELKVLGKPKYIKLKSGYDANIGKYTIITYRLDGFYQNGEAVLDISVIDNDDKISIYLFAVHVSSDLFNTSSSTISSTSGEWKDKVKGSWVGSFEFKNLRSTWCATYKDDGQLKILFRNLDLVSGKALRPLVTEGTWLINGDYISNETRILDLQNEYRRDNYKILTLSEDYFSYQGLLNDKTIFESKRVADCGSFLSKPM